MGIIGIKHGRTYNMESRYSSYNLYLKELMIEFNITNPIIIYVSIMTSSASTLSSMSWISNSYTLLMLDINEMCLL